MSCRFFRIDELAIPPHAFLHACAVDPPAIALLPWFPWFPLFPFVFCGDHQSALAIAPSGIVLAGIGVSFGINVNTASVKLPQLEFSGVQRTLTVLSPALAVRLPTLEGVSILSVLRALEETWADELSTLELSLVVFARLQRIAAMTIKFPINKTFCVGGTAAVVVNTLAGEFATAELTCITLPTLDAINTKTRELAIREVTFVTRTIRPLQLALTMKPAIANIAPVPATIRQHSIRGQNQCL